MKQKYKEIKWPDKYLKELKILEMTRLALQQESVNSLQLIKMKIFKFGT
jgi:hypothetical protein